MGKEDNSINIASEGFLGEVLKGYGISVEKWGKGEAKTVGHLFRELEEGDCVLVEIPEGELRREVVFVSGDVYYQSPEALYYLREEKQVFKDGRERRRAWMKTSVGEKVKPEESAEETRRRVFEEELGIKGSVSIEESQIKQRSGVSFSYPGLWTEYEVYPFKAFLTKEQYRPEGYIEEQEDKTTYWVWGKIE